MTRQRVDRLRRSIVALACAFNVLSVLCLEYQDRRLRSDKAKRVLDGEVTVDVTAG